MARRRRPEPVEAQPDGDVPDWVWGDELKVRRWAADHGGLVEGRYEAVKQWYEKRDAWLRERGLVVFGMGGLSWEAYKRIQRDEPHRILRRPRP